MDSVPAVELVAVGKRFPGVVALEGVSCSVPAGVCQALCGENGAGKSTLGNLLAGIHAPDQGQLRLFGQPIRFARPADARRAGVSMVHQELAFADNLNIAENLCLARLPRRWGFVDRRELAAQARRLLAAIGVDGGAGRALDVHRPVAALTVGEQQLVQIAGAVGGGARLIVLDEPTSSLTSSEVERLFVLLDRLKAQGVTLLYITHRMPEIFRLCERVTVLRDGRHVITRDRAGLTEAELVRAMIGRELPPSGAPRAAGPSARPVRLAVRRLASPGRFAEVSFELRTGEILGLGGLVGAGRTEILKALFGLDPAATGEVQVEGVPVRPRSPRAARALGLGLVPEDRKRQGLVLGLTARENLTLPLLHDRTVIPALARAGFVRRRAERELTARLFQQLRLRASAIDAPAVSLSGGNQQKVVLARWLGAGSRILLLDEPTRGVDVGAKAEVHALIEALAAGGVAVLLVSSDLPELLALSHRILVLREGRVAGELSRAEASEEAVVRLMVGAPPPPDHSVT